MIKQLKTLIKVAEGELDERRRELIALQTRLEEVENMILHLEQELSDQRALLSRDPSYGLTFKAYEISNKERRRVLADHGDDIRKNISLQEERVAEAYRELKKYEVTLDNKLKEMEVLLDKKDQHSLDEAASNKWRRGEKESKI